MFAFSDELNPIFSSSMKAWHQMVASPDVLFVSVFCPTELGTEASARRVQTLCSVFPQIQSEPMLLTRQNGLDSSIVEVGAVADLPDLTPFAQRGARSFCRVSVQVPVYQAIDLYIFSSLDVGKLESRQYELYAFTMVNWPSIRHGLRAQYSPFTAREVRCLAQAYAGFTAKETSIQTGWPERTVVMHLRNATTKAGTKNKLAALQWATLLGHFF